MLHLPIKYKTYKFSRQDSNSKNANEALTFLGEKWHYTKYIYLIREFTYVGLILKCKQELLELISVA